MNELQGRSGASGWAPVVSGPSGVAMPAPPGGVAGGQEPSVSFDGLAYGGSDVLDIEVTRAD